MPTEYRLLENAQEPKKPTTHIANSNPTMEAPEPGDRVTVKTRDNIFLNILVEKAGHESIKGEIVTIGPASITKVDHGEPDLDGWKLGSKIEVKTTHIEGVHHND